MPLEGISDTGDLIDRSAPDPTPEEITDPEDLNYVEPYDAATKPAPAAVTE